MTITQTNSTASTDLLKLLQAAESSSTNSTSSSTSSSTQASSSTSTSDSTSVSGPGQLFSQLEQLSKSNPEEFKKITASISQQLSTAAGNSTDSSQANFLNQMSANFAKASQSGNFSDLFPSQSGNSGAQGSAPPPPPPPSNSAAAAYSSNSSNPVESIFAQALQQIQSDLGTSSSSSN